MTTTTQDNLLSEVFESVGKAHGYKTITAVYSASRDFRVKWERTPICVKFKVSDYLSRADRETLTEFAERMFSRLKYNFVPYGDRLRGYVLSDDFLYRVQPLFIKRSKGFDRAEGSVEDRLYKSIARLELKGLYPDVKDIVFYWTNERMQKAGYCASLSKVVAITSKLNCDECPDYVLDYLAFHFASSVKIGRDVFGTDRDFNYELEVAESGYEGKDAAVRWLKAMGMFV